MHTAAVASASASSAAVAVDLDDDPDPELCPGRLVEFKRNTRVGLGYVTRADGKSNWEVVDSR